MSDPRDTGGVAARSARSSVAPPPRPAPVIDPSPSAEIEPSPAPAGRRSTPPRSASGKRGGSKAASKGRITVNVPIDVRRWLRAYTDAVGLKMHEVVLEAASTHGPTLTARPPRAGRPVEDGVRIDLYVTGDERGDLEALARALGWSISETVSELLALERAAATSDPDAVASRLADRLRGVR